jgi:branched-chain amino acid transport system substrate-binding protein
MQTKLRLVAAMSAVTLLMVACGSDTKTTTSSSSSATAGSSGGAAPSGEPWVIAAVIPLSGASAPFFTPALATYQAGVDYLNAHGGIAGRPVKIETLDSAGAPAQAISVLTSYLDSHTPQMVMAGQTSALSAPMLPILTQRKIFSSASTVAQELNDPAKYPYHFPAPPTTDQVESALATYLGQQSYKKLAFLGPDNASGQSAQAAFQKAASSSGLTVTSVLMDPTSVDATAQLNKLKDSGPDVLVLDGYGAFAGVFLKTKARLSWNVPTVADETFAANNLGDLATADDLKGVKLQFFAFGIKDDPASKTPVAQFLLDAMKKAGATTNAFWANAVNWNSMVLAKMAGDKAGSGADGPALAKALETFQEIPADLKDMFFGAPKLGFSSTNHAPQWTASDFTFLNAGPLEDGLLVPQR